jgi:hypothetical protein
MAIPDRRPGADGRAFTAGSPHGSQRAGGARRPPRPGTRQRRACDIPGRRVHALARPLRGVDLRWGIAFQVRDDKISRVDVHGDWARASKPWGCGIGDVEGERGDWVCLGKLTGGAGGGAMKLPSHWRRLRSFRDGVPIRIREFLDPEAALEAVGLRQ